MPINKDSVLHKNKIEEDMKTAIKMVLLSEKDDHLTMANKMQKSLDKWIRNGRPIAYDKNGVAYSIYSLQKR